MPFSNTELTYIKCATVTH